MSSLKDRAYQYFKGEIDGYQLIRDATGMINPEHAVHIVALCCTIARHEQGDIDTETFKKVWFEKDQEGGEASKEG